MFEFSIIENTVSLLPTGELTAKELFKVIGEEVTRVEVYQYNTWVVAYMSCINGVWKPLYMDEDFLSMYWGEDSCQAILKHTGVLDKNKIKTFRR